MFFETYNAFVHIDIKTVTTNNINDFSNNIFVGDNQNSYNGKYSVKGAKSREYSGNLPTFYTKNDKTKKICLTYFIVILYNKLNLKIESLIVTCMPNGELSDVYGDSVLSAGKNKEKIRFNYSKVKYFELLEDKSLRTKVLILDPENKDIAKKLTFIKEVYDQQKT